MRPREAAQVHHFCVVCCRVYGLQSYSQLSHAGSLLGGSLDGVIQFLSSLAKALQPDAQRQVEEIQAQCKQHQLHPYELDWAVSTLLQARCQPLPQAAQSLAQQLSLADLLHGMSSVLKGTMGVWLEPLPPQHQGTQGTGQPPGPCHMSNYVASLQQASCAAEAAGTSAHEVHAFSVHHEDRGLVGSLLVHPSAGFGARYLSMGCNPEAASPLLPSAASPAAAGTAALGPVPIVVLGLHWSKCDHPPLADLIRELLHEMGHALHLILSQGTAHCVTSVAAQQRSLSSAGFAACPLQLPLELIELPASILELLCAQPRAMCQLLAASAAAGSCSRAADQATVELLAHAVALENQSFAYSPVHLLLQTMTAVVDTLMLREESAGTDAVQLWVDLCTATLPQPLPPMFTVQQVCQTRPLKL